MPATKDAADDLKAAIKVAKQRDLNFALCLGKKPESTLILTHRTKAAEALGRQAKKEGETPKLAFGTMNVDGREMKLSCANKPPSGMARRARLFLKNSVGLSMTITVLGPDGEVVESDADEEETNEVSANQTAADDAADPRAAEWAQKKAELEPQVMRFVSSPAGDASKVRAAWALALEQGDGEGDAGNALRIAANIETIMAADGGAPQQKGDAPQPAEAKWLAARDKVEPHVLEALKLNTEHKSKIEAVWAFANGKADATPPDHAAALKALAPLSGLIAQARAARKSDAELAAKARQDTIGEQVDKLKAECEMVIARIRPTVEARLADGSASDTVRKAWMIAQDKADAKEYATALQLLERISTLLKSPDAGVAAASAAGSATASGAGDGGDGPREGGDTPAEPGKLAANLLRKADIDAVKDEVKAAKAEVAKFPDTPSPDWTTDLDAALKAMTDIDAKTTDAEITSAIQDARNKIEGVLADLGATLTGRESWLKELALFKERIKILENHPMQATPPVGGGAGKIADIKTKLTAAETAAKTERKYSQSKTGLTALRKLADDAEVFADDLAHYTEVAKGRKTLFDALPATAPGGAHQSLVDALQAVKDLWNAAEAHKGNEKFKEGVEELNKMRTAHEAYLKVKAARDKYTETLNNYNSWYNPANTDAPGINAKVSPILGADNPVKKGVIDELARAQTAVAAATPANVNSYYFAESKVSRELNIIARVVSPRCDAADTFADALVAFNAAYNDPPMRLKTHPGIDGIQEFVNQMATDLTDATAAANDYKFGLAEKLLEATSGKWATWDQMAKDYVTYKAKYDTVKPKVEVVISDTTGFFDTFFDAADLASCMTAAETARVAKDFPRAVKELEAAEEMVEYVKTLKETAKKTDEAVKDKDTKLGDVANNFDPAYKVYTDLRGLVAGVDPALDTELAKADAEAKKAKDAHDGGTGKPADIQKDLEEAIKIIEPLTLKVQRAKAYRATRQKVDTEIAALKNLPADQKDGAKADWEAMEQLVRDAENAIKSPGYDFQGAEAHMNEALRKGRDGRAKAELYPKIKAILDHVEGPLATAGDLAGLANGAVLFDKEIAQCRKYDTDIKAKMTAGDYPEAYELAKRAKRNMEPLWEKQTSYQEAFDTYSKVSDPYSVTNLKTAFNGYDQVVKDRRSARIAQLDTQYAAQMTAHDFAGAARTAFNIKMEIWKCEGTQKTLEPWKTDKAAAAQKIKDLDDVKNDGVTEELAALNKLMTDAEAKATEFKFAEACNIVKPIAARSDAAQKVAEAYKQYAAAKTAADVEVAKLDGKDEIKPLKDRVDAKMANAEALRVKADYAGAKALLDQVPGDVTSALATNAKNQALTDLSGNVDGMDETDDAAAKKAVEDAKALVEELSKDPNAAFVLPRMAPMRTALETAETKAKAGGDAATVKKLLKAVIVTAKRLQTELWNYEQLSTIAARAEARATGLEAAHTGKDHIAADVAKIKERIASLLPDARASGETDPGLKAAETIFDDIIRLGEMRDAYKTYKDRADALDAQLLVLDKHAHRYAIKDELDKIRAALTRAAGEAASSDPAAEKSLDDAAGMILDAEIEVKMRANEPPTPDQLKKLLARPDGLDKLDEIVNGTDTSEGLDEPTKRKVYAAAFEARFGCDLQVKTGNLSANLSMEDKGPNLARMYKAMSKLPDVDTITNDALMVYITSPQGGGSSFDFSTKEAIVREGNTEYSWNYRFGDAYEVGNVDPGCEPKNTDPVEALDWNTIHEVGHAVDDKQKYMEGPGGTHANWKFHFGDFAPVAKVFAAHFKYDEKYALAYVSGNSDPPIPEPPANKDIEEWERARMRLVSHVDNCRNGRHPWKTSSGAAKLAVKDNGTDRVYHEAYDGRWVSYDLSARKQAITGYQFRAPAEWFSELYAAYHCDKLKNSHPAMTWLQRDFPKKTAQTP